MQNLPFVGDFCTPDTAVRGGLLAGLFLAGVAGSVVHCAPMCGAFVLGQVSERMARLPASQLCEWRRIGGGMLLPYHLGRLMTYAALGTLAAGSAAVVARSAWFTDLSAALLVAAAVLFLALAARRVLPARVRLDHVPRSWGTLLARVTRPIPRGTAVREFLLGIALGFLPCGFLYAALTAAAATGQPMLGAGGDGRLWTRDGAEPDGGRDRRPRGRPALPAWRRGCRPGADGDQRHAAAGPGLAAHGVNHGSA